MKRSDDQSHFEKVTFELRYEVSSIWKSGVEYFSQRSNQSRGFGWE